MSKKNIKSSKNMKILLSFLTISTSKEPHLSDSSIIDEGLESRSDHLHSNVTNNGLQKRLKPLDHPFKNMVFFIEFCNKTPKESYENDLAVQDNRHDNFVEIGNYCSEEATRLDILNNTKNYNNKTGSENFTQINATENSRKKSLMHQKETGLFMRKEIMKILELKHNEPHRDQIKLKESNKGIKNNFVSKFKEFKSDIGRRFSNFCLYTHNNINICSLYGYLLKPKICCMENLSLLQILISEVEYSNKLMIYCFLSSNTYKLLCFITEGVGKLRITPMFFYQVGYFMKKYKCFNISINIKRKFVCPWKKGNYYGMYGTFSGFIKIYMTLKTHCGIKMPELSNEINYITYKKEGLVISELYNKIKSRYNGNLADKI